MIQITLYVFAISILCFTAVSASDSTLGANPNSTKLHHHPKHLELAELAPHECTEPGQSGTVKVRLSTNEFKEFFGLFLLLPGISVIIDDTPRVYL